MAAHAPGPPFYATTTTKKQASFLSTPLQDTALHDVPGIGSVSHTHLTNAGVGTSQQLMGHFLIMNRDVDAMARWLQAAGVRAQEVGKIVDALERKGRATVAV